MVRSGEFTSFYEKRNLIKRIDKYVKTKMDEKEGCQIVGFLDINKVPGNFHISVQ